MKKIELTSEQEFELYDWFWTTSGIFVFSELQDFKELLKEYPQEIYFIASKFVQEGLTARHFINVMNREEDFLKLIEVTRPLMKKVSKTKTRKIMYALQDKEVEAFFNISSLDSYDANNFYSLIKNSSKEKLLSLGLKYKKYPTR